MQTRSKLLLLLRTCWLVANCSSRRNPAHYNLHYVRGGSLSSPLGEAKERKLCTSCETTDTPGMPLPISLPWLERPHKDVWVL